MSAKITTGAGVNYGIWWLGWRERGFWFEVWCGFGRGPVVSIGLGLFAVGRGY